MNAYSNNETKTHQDDWLWTIFRFLYDVSHFLTVVLIFFGCWIYAIAAYGLFLGLALGWIPSLIIALIVAIVFPIIFYLILAGLLLGLIVYLRGA